MFRGKANALPLIESIQNDTAAKEAATKEIEKLIEEKQDPEFEKGAKKALARVLRVRTF